MVTLTMLWLAILVSTVLVFIASMLIWMVLPIHAKDFRGLPDEASVAEALRRQGATPGQYMIPWGGGRGAMKDAEFLERWDRGPLGILTLAPAGRPNMGKRLGTWFLYILVVSVFLAYLASRTLPPGAAYLPVFRVVGTAGVLAYSAAVVPSGIWFSRPWSNVWKDVFDGVVYGLLSAGVFGWLWPR